MPWLPDHIWRKQGGGKGVRKSIKPTGGKGGGWGRKGQGRDTRSWLQKAKSDVKVWIGGLPDTGAIDKELNKKLMEHLKQGGDCKYAEIKKGGVGGAVYKTAEEAMNAVMALNNSEFEGNYIQMDAWEKKAKLS
mmetsp:Transcript_134823/g.234372  ORF Transcript_134823/g.234372 Transcript_134823/m.234372 type:complete len:134 (+) Transcript_134823:71-472(+)